MKSIYVLMIFLLSGFILKAQCPTAGNDTAVCGLSIQLNATVNIGDYNTHWIYPAGITLANVNSATTSATASLPGTYNLIWEVTNSLGNTCDDTVSVTFNAVPTASFAITSSVCSGQTVTATYTGSGANSYMWNFGTGTPGTAVTPGPHSIIYNSPGTIAVTLHVVSANGCHSDTVTHTVVVNPLPSSDFTAESPVCVGVPGIVTYTGASTPIAYSWNIGGPPTSITPGLSGPGPYSVIWGVANTVNISLTVSNTMTGCSSTATIHQVQVLPSGSPACCIVPTPNAGLDETVCGNVCTLQGSLPAVGNVITWTQLSGPGVSTFSDAGSYNSSVAVSCYGTYVFQVTEVNGSCDSSDFVTISFIQQFLHSEAGVSQNVCGTTTVLSADTLGSGITSAYWTCNTPGIVITNGPVGDPIPWQPTVDISLLPNMWISSKRDVWFYWVAQNGVGCSDFDSVLVTFYEIPEAHAGLDSSTCGKIFEMQGQASITNYTGTWSLLSTPPPGGSAVFSPVNQTNAQVTVTQYGYYNFIWKEMNAGNTTCFDRDTVKINFLTVPTPDAGLDFSVCGVYAHIHATPSVSGGQWSGPPGIAFYDGIGGNYNDSYRDSASSYFRYTSENDTVTMYWIEFNGLCYGHDSVNVYFGSIQPAITLVNPADSVVCGPVYTLLNAQQPAYGYGYWYDTLINTEFYPSDTSLNPIVAIDNFSYGYHLFRWVTVNDLCRDTSEAISVLFKANIIKGMVQSSLVTDFSSFKAELLPELNMQNIPFSTNTLTSAGNYSLWAEPNHNYYLKITATDPLLYPTIANTYYNNTYNWQDATLITTTGNCDTLSFNVPLVTMTPATGGTCRIYGLVRYDVSFAPVNNAMVYLRYQPNQDPARFAFTNQNGYYSVNNVTTGNYKLFVDIPGLPQVTNHHIIVNPNDTVFANVNFIVDTTSISKDYGFGIYADTSSMIHVPVILSEGIEISVFPNPFTDKLYITGTLIKPESVYVELIDNSGKTIFISQEKTLTDGKFTLPLSINGLTDGMYFIKIDIGNNTYIKKINKN